MTPAPFLLSRDGLPVRLQRLVRLVPAEGYGLGRRILLVVLLAWLPMAAWAALTGRLNAASPDDPLLHHLGIHVRLLLAVPLLLIAEPMVDARLAKVLAHFRESGLIGADARAGFDAVLARAARWRDSWLPLLILVGLIVLEAIRATGVGSGDAAHEVRWAAEASTGLGFGGVWYLAVARSIFTLLIGFWLWRGVVILGLLRGISKLPLTLVPTHPDRAAGLGFLTELTSAAAPITLAISAVLSARLAHEALFHDTPVTEFKAVLIVFLVVVAVALTLPFLMFAGQLVKARRSALFDYGALVARHGHLVERRWLRKEDIGSQPLLDAPELGPVADIHVVFDAVERLRPMLLTPRVVMQSIMPAVLPLLPLLAIDVPLAELLKRLLKLVV